MEVGGARLSGSMRAAPPVPMNGLIRSGNRGLACQCCFKGCPSGMEVQIARGCVTGKFPQSAARRLGCQSLVLAASQQLSEWLHAGSREEAWHMWC